jgi:hypothetical protein
MCLKHVLQNQLRDIIYTHCVFADSERSECYIIRRLWVVQFYFSFTGIAAQLQLRSPIFILAYQNGLHLWRCDHSDHRPCTERQSTLSPPSIPHLQTRGQRNNRIPAARIVYRRSDRQLPSSTKSLPFYDYAPTRLWQSSSLRGKPSILKACRGQ